MAAAFVLGFIVVIVLLAIVSMKNDDLENEIHCQGDVPCQECGKCYQDHPGSAFGGHSYVYPRDLHR